MKIETKKLSKDVLVELVDALRKDRVVTDELVKQLYRHDLIKQSQKHLKDFQKIEAELKRGRLSVKAHNAKVDTLNRIADTGNKKLAILKELDNADQS